MYISINLLNKHDYDHGKVKLIEYLKMRILKILVQTMQILLRKVTTFCVNSHTYVPSAAHCHTSPTPPCCRYLEHYS